ncbi:5'-nucleotidase C-terminal domain-containing protein [Psychroflexus salis]|uniref:5'-Nucleotidase C-terminal domain-containing protein n=1 Tax=Psychroflexus salis TaxID=1526574 RepID=A0A917EB80_9FLAO|nr:5'-nucleotidase [Psychroflexus salis]GGE20652.1 hypothetical protein GCM10010831_22220 [Psychroflexus salis]
MKTQIINILLICISLGALSCEKEYVKPVKINYKQQAIDANLMADEEIENFIAPYKSRIEGEMKKVLSYAPQSMFKSQGKYNTAIGNMMADAVLEEATPIFKKQQNLNIDAVLLNYGGIRAGISKGDISVRTAFDIMPFENEVVVVELTYESVQKMIRYLMKKKIAHPIAGIQLQLNHDYTFKKASINGEEIKLNDQKDKHFYIATSDYLLQGGDEMSFFEDNKNVYHLDYKLRNILIDYFEKKEQILATVEKRFTVSDSF